ncbi:MAG: InlB B-repeat-containing protein [Treponema sp.]|uniref:InlB B-repeat-containing protein n=1 Tax=Treponema sp. TaxID=166 RepID=UPI002A90CE60|nr:InlB B-repeat-containing protein [Treponema sp.]MDY6396574.1 InlB B-repeat-containing protein [Treponema sp.]
MHKLSKALTFMGAILALTFCAVSCKTDDGDEPTMYTVTVLDSIEHGKVSVDKTSAEAGAKVKLTPTADNGYELDSYSVKDASANEFTVTEGTFTMPKSNVTVSATFKETAETVNQKAAAAVIAKITAIGTVAYTDESKAKIEEARNAYEELTGAQKKLVPAKTLALLTAAETAYAELKAAADSENANQTAADAVIAKITAIGTVTYTSESKAKIDEARKAYDALTGAQKELVPAETLSVLTAAETKYSELKAAADSETANKNAANAVIAKITAIGTVTYTSESKAKIDEARKAYDALTGAQKALIPAETLAVLTNAESTYGTLKAAAEQQTATYTVKIASGIANGTVTASPTSATAGTEITLTAEAASGFTFDSYSVTDADGKTVTVTDNKFTMPTSNVTVSATFTALPPATASYTVKHLQQNIADNNYTLKESETKTGTVGQPTDASAKSYDGFTAQTVTQATIAASGTVVEIKYDRKTYTVTFDSNGGSDVSSQSLRYGATATKPADPTKTATTTTEYTFADWYSDSGLTTSFSFDTAIKEDITLYAKWTETTVTPQKTAGSISYATTTVSKTTGDAAFTNELTIEGNGTVTYSSSDETVATVNASTGEVTIVGAGTATITATVTDSASYTYATKTASYTLTVTVAVTSVIINNAPSEALFVNSTGTLTATVSPDNATDKTIVWSSSDSDYVSINSETGEYTIMGTKGYGSATITATATNGTEDTSDDVTATCTITGKVTYTSLKAGDVLHTGDTFYTGSTVYFKGNTNASFSTTMGVITIVEATKDGYTGKFYQFKRSSNGTWPNWSYSVKDNTDGVYITGGSGTSSGDRFTLAVHTKE